MRARNIGKLLSEKACPGWKLRYTMYNLVVVLQVLGKGVSGAAIWYDTEEREQNETAHTGRPTGETGWNRKQHTRQHRGKSNGTLRKAVQHEQASKRNLKCVAAVRRVHQAI